MMLDANSLKGEVVHGQYLITDPIDAGSFGWVFRADHMVLGQTVSPIAIKILKDDHEEDEAVLREVRYLMECVHPHVIRVHESGMNHAEGPLHRRFFIAMELADESLEARLKRAPVSRDEALVIAANVCNGLAHLHARNVVHRDLKPANVLCVDGTWKLSDFGLARFSGHLRTLSRVGGTPAYSPPEGLDDELKPSFDMWSLGCILHQCVTGQLPSFNRDHKVKLDRALPEPFKTVISRCLKQDPDRRPSALECLHQLDETATPIFSPHGGGGSCFLCDEEAGVECATGELRGTLARVKKVRDGYECLVYSAGELEGVTLLLTQTWADHLGARLHAEFDAFSRRPHPVTLSAFHLQKRKRGLCATDASLVVLDPDWLVSATDLRGVHGCERVRLVDRYEVFKQNKYLVLGNTVGDLLEDTWSESAIDRGRQVRALEGRVRDIAQANDVELRWTRKDIDKHVARLVEWAKAFNQHPYTLHTETTVIAPDLGLKGRIDALWFSDDERVALGELKSGSRRDEDELQLSAYGLMLASRGEVDRDRVRSMLLYSKPPWGADEGVEKRVELSHDRFRQAVVARNKVLMIDSSTNASFGEDHCDTCVQRNKSGTCTLLAHLFGHADTRSSALRDKHAAVEQERLAGLDEAQRRFFVEHQGKIQAELRAARSKQARLWSCTPEQREREGLALRFQAALPLGKSGSRHRYGLVAGPNANHSQIQTENRVTLSGPEGPTQGRLVIATVVHASGDGIEVECHEPLPFQQGWASAEIDDKLVGREFTALFQWIVNPRPVRDAVVHNRPPTLDPLPRGWKLPPGHTLNDQQKQAVEQSVRTRDYLLVLGPPGAGKTTLLSAMVKAHLDLGRRILVSANSNRALDQVVRTLMNGGLASEVLRLGRLQGMSEDVRACALDSCYDPNASVEMQVNDIRRACATKRVVAATASSLAAGDFEPILGKFDLVIVDEATQVSLPLSLGPLRYADRFVLVGDPNQLAPIRMSADGPSLFEVLEGRVRESGAEGLVELRDQYRMNAEICRIPSDMWYKRALRPGSPAVASGRLAINLRKIPKDFRELLDPKRPVVFLDVPSDFSHGPRMNREEARRVADIVAALHAADPSLPQKIDDRLGILAPYRAQVACIRNHLAERMPKGVESRHWVDTVDRFQGGERDIMVISLVGARDGNVPDHLRDQRRLNVALSRARHKLIVIGDHDFLARDRLFADLFTVMASVDPDYRIKL